MHILSMKKRFFLCFLCLLMMLPGCGYSTEDLESAYDQGYEEGTAYGYDEGQDKGYDDGYSDGQSEGYKVGYQEGYDDGYDDGYEDGEDTKSDSNTSSSYGGSTYNSVSTPVDSTPYSVIVYITETGSKYHRFGCQYLSDSCYQISLSDAERKGYTPCSRCW